MPKFRKLTWIILVLSVSVFCVKAQAPRGAAEQQRQDEINRQNKERDFNERSNNLHVMMQESLKDRQAAFLKAHAGRQKSLTKEEKAKIKQILAPNEEDLNKYQNFLEQKNTGIFRLFPDWDCEGKNTLRVDGKCADTVPGSWLYSFRRNDYADTNLKFSDIQFRDGNLISKGFLVQGILTNLGDTPLEKISPADARIKFLLDFKPEKQSAEAKKQYSEIESGIDFGGFKYSKSVVASENTTYALRAVAYRTEANKFYRNTPETNSEDLKFLFLNLDKREDITVVFRIVRRDENGSITILWKELNRQDSPKIVFPKNEKLSDIKE